MRPGWAARGGGPACYNRRMPTDLILGTAGHIDHGKTSLIKALTGVDTDRLPEEKRRGITIDLGFASLDLGEFRLGIVDVPGHERFVRNMLAGATGMDLALLVVAADDGVKPQTIEHLEILRLLDLPAGVIALTKADAVDQAWLDLVGDEVRALVAGTPLAAAPMIPTSVVNGQGLEALRRALGDAARHAARVRSSRIAAPLRMPIDRVFHVAGHGVVVTGSVQSGEIAVGDELEIQPGSLPVRVRGLQNHEQPVERVWRGQRAAVNLAGVKSEQLARGQELVAPHHLRPTRTLTTRIHLAGAARALKQRAVCRLHLGAAELLGKLRLLESSRLEPGETALAQWLLDRDAVAVWGQPLVLRSQSPITTIGGGIVIDPHAPLLRHPTARELELLADWQSDQPVRRAGAALYFAGLGGWQPTDLYAAAGVSDARATAAELRAAGTLLSVPLSPTRTLDLHREVLERLEQRLERALQRLHDEQPLRSVFPLSLVAQRVAFSDRAALLDLVVQRLVAAHTLRQLGASVGLARRGPQLSQNEQKLLRQLVAWFREAGVESPSIAELKKRATKNQAAIPQLVALAAEDGELVRIADDYWLHAEVDRRLQARLAAGWPADGQATLSQVRELLGTSRKYAVPYCEYLDRIGFTIRDGDTRRLAPGIGAAAGLRASKPGM